METDWNVYISHDILDIRWEMHTTILKSLQKQAKHIHAWWEFTGRPDPGEDGVVESLKRLVSGVLTHPITIGNKHLKTTIIIALNYIVNLKNYYT